MSIPRTSRIIALTLMTALVLHEAVLAAPADTNPVITGNKDFRKPAREIAPAEEGFLWIDAEDFTDYGGWWLDTQFVHLMGSAYLIAAGIGEPVADASLSFDLPAGGTYRLWVRARNWVKGHAPGQFQVLVNGKASERTFGMADSGDWCWESGGDFELGAGEVTLALHDLTGYYGRCDALILTEDLAYVPPEGPEAVQQERGRLTGLDLAPQDAGEFDVVVVGAGAAGSVAALASARMGAHTALIQNRPVLGGNASVELGVPINGAASAHPNARESGIIEETGRIKARYGYPKMSEPFRIAAEAEPNLGVFLNSHVFAAEMAGDARIGAVKAVNTLTGRITTYRGKVFIDCTGDGWVGYYAGADFRLGREAQDEYGEDLAPVEADTITMSGCIMGPGALCFRAEDSGAGAPYTPPPWAPKLPGPEEFGRAIRRVTGGEWWIEHPGTVDDLWQAEYARDELIRITFGYWDFIKNEWPGRARASRHKLVYVPIVDAKRETRRLMGDYVLTQDDVMSGRVFPDRISYGGWPLDIHHPEGVFSGKEGPFHSNNRLPIYTIPFRCLYSANIENLLFAGRDASVSHMALGTVRVQGTLAALGQAAGTAAALCAGQGVSPRALCEGHIGELQQVLVKYDQYIPGIVNEDPDDVARTASVTASSTAAAEYFDKANVSKTDMHPLNMPRAVMFPMGLTERVGTVHVLLKSENAASTPVTLHLRSALVPGNFDAREDLATAQAEVPPNGETWVAFTLDKAVGAPLAWVWLDKSPGVSWSLMGKAPHGACRAYGGDGRWTLVEGQYYAAYTDPPLGVEVDYRPENIINGVARIVGSERNMWQSDPGQPLPQWVELAFEAPVDINTVYLTFDTDMNAPYHTVALVPECVRDYEVAVYDGREWKTVATVAENFQRRRVHAFGTVKAAKVRLTVHATNGAPAARVFEIRAYAE